MTLSASSIKTYQDCHLQWYWTYVEAREEPPNEPRQTGIEVHDYAEVLLKDGIPLAESGPCGICEMVPHSDQCPRKGDTVARLVDVFIDDIMPTYGKPVLVEAAFELDVEGIEYTGFIDSVDKHHHPHPPEVDWDSEGREAMVPIDLAFDELILRDLKTTKNRPRKGKYRDNMIGYYLGARELGHEPALIQLDYIVRTKKPYYWPEEQAIPDDDEIDIWAGQVVQTARDIEQADWEPTGVGTFVCSWCPWKDICGPYARYQDMTSPLKKEAR